MITGMFFSYLQLSIVPGSQCGNNDSICLAARHIWLLSLQRLPSQSPTSICPQIFEVH
jgi:hypothetical protein